MKIRIVNKMFLFFLRGAPNNYRIDRVSGDPSVIARSPCDEAIQGPQQARRQQPKTVVLRPLDCFASLAMTDRELAYLFLRVALDGLCPAMTENDVEISCRERPVLKAPTNKKVFNRARRDDREISA